MPPLRRVLPQNGSLTRVFGFLVNLRESRDDGWRERTMRHGLSAACHSLEPERNLTGPSLSGVVERKAGTLPSYHSRRHRTT